MKYIKGVVQIFILLVSWLKALTDGSDVTQTPQLWRNKSQSATMNCSHTKGSSYFQMYWYRQRPGQTMEEIVFTTLTPPHQYQSGFSKERYPAEKKDAETGSLTVKTLLPDDSAIYFCSVRGYTDIAYFGVGTKLTVLEHDVKEPKVEILGPSPKECRNEKDHEKKKTLLCVVSEFYPDHISVFWQVNENNVTSGVATDEIAQRDGKFYTMSSRLRVSAEDWFNPENEFKCIVIFFDGENYQRNESTINGEQSTVELNYRDKYLKATQKVKLSYTVFIIKSSIYGAFVAFLVWKLQRSTGK